MGCNTWFFGNSVLIYTQLTLVCWVNWVINTFNVLFALSYILRFFARCCHQEIRVLQYLNFCCPFIKDLSHTDFTRICHCTWINLWSHFSYIRWTPIVHLTWLWSKELSHSLLHYTYYKKNYWINNYLLWARSLIVWNSFYSKWLVSATDFSFEFCLL